MKPIYRISLIALVLVALVAGALLLANGCSVTTQDRAATLRTYVAAGQKVSKDLDSVAVELRAAIDAGTLLLGDPNLPAAEMAEVTGQLKSLTTKLASAAAEKQKIDAFLVTWQKQIELLAVNPQANIGDELGLYGSGLVTSSDVLPQPWAAYARLAGGLLLIFGGAVGRHLATQKRDKENAVEAEAFPPVIRSVEKLLNSLPTEEEETPEVVTREDAVQILKDAQASAKISAVVDSLTKAPIEKL